MAKLLEEKVAEISQIKITQEVDEFCQIKSCLLTL